MHIGEKERERWAELARERARGGGGKGSVGGRGTQTNGGEWQVCIAHTNKAISH